MFRRTLSLAKTGSGSLLLAQFATVSAGAITGIVTARVLAPAGRGDLAIVTYWPTLFASVMDLSIRETVNYVTARPGNDPRKTTAAGVLVGILCAVSALVVGYFLLPIVLTDEQHHLLRATRWYLAFAPAWLISCALVGALMGLHRYADVGKVRIWTSGLYLVSIVLAAVADIMTVELVAAFTFAATALTTPICLVYLRRALRGPRSSGTADGSSSLSELAIDQAKLGARLQTSRLSSLLVAAQDRAIAAWLLTQAQLGAYQVPVTITQVMPIIPTALGMLLFSKVAAAAEPDRTSLILSSYTRTMVLSGGVALLLLPFLPLLVPMLYGDAFRMAVAPASIALIGAVFAAGTAVLQSGARARLRIRACIEADFAGIATMALAGFHLTRHYGMEGLAFAYLLGRLVSFIWIAARASVAVGLRPIDLVPFSRGFRQSVRDDWKFVRARVSKARP